LLLVLLLLLWHLQEEEKIDDGWRKVVPRLLLGRLIFDVGSWMATPGQAAGLSLG
jgi:hypothetical protein